MPFEATDEDYLNWNEMNDHSNEGDQDEEITKCPWSGKEHKDCFYPTPYEGWPDVKELSDDESQQHMIWHLNQENKRMYLNE